MNIERPKIMPVFYFPTTTYLIDDNVAFLELFKAELEEENLAIKIESDPQKALNFFNHEYKQNAFWLKCFTKLPLKVWGGSQEVVVDVFSIHKQMYNSKRFDEATNIVSDYAMPELTGLELFMQVKTTDDQINPRIQLIMLTGVLDTAVDVHEHLNAFFRKNGPVEKLISKILSGERIYFEDASLGIIYRLHNDPENRTGCLTDEKFISFFWGHVRDQKIVEQYLLDKQGSKVMLDKHANLSWFFIRNDLGMEQSINLAKKYNAPQGVIHALERHEKLLYIYDENEFQKNTAVNWNDYLYPVQIFEGKQKYYYAFVSDIKHHSIEKDKILSFADYLESN
ncbi:MAG: hypothetical protein JSS53_01895 [Proteobacteria bacterium]|nr:hypothetical protein [Pseudomonadota bacterium]